ncbi:hypothetical protein DIPPA_21688 [Diplonema papillatum]|nr:hypothetical protein DIPPA_21688 [Diplonema papillatum]
MGQSNFKDGEYVPVAISDPDLAKLQQQQQQQQQQRVSLSPVITMSSPGVSPIRRGDGENESGAPTPMSTATRRLASRCRTATRLVQRDEAHAAGLPLPPLLFPRRDRRRQHAAFPYRGRRVALQLRHREAAAWASSR